MPPAIVRAISAIVSMPKASMPASRNSARTAPRKSHSPETMKTTGILDTGYSILHKVKGWGHPNALLDGEFC